MPGHVICKRLWWAWACAACSVVAHGQLLASSDFLFGNDGWRVTSEDVLEVQLETRSSALYGRDTGDSVWYFEAPDAYLGEKSTAYAGSLSFRRSHSQYVDRSTPVLDDWDVTISSETYGLRLGASLSKLRGLEYALPLTNEHDPVWMNIDAGHIASKFEIVRVLHDLTSVRIRGGIYGGAEEVWLAMVKLIQGDDSPQHAQLVRRYVNDALGRDRDDSADVPDEEDAPLDMPTASLLDVSTAPGEEAIKNTPLDPQLQPGAVGPDMERSTPGALTDQSTQVSATNRRARGSIIGEASMRQPSHIPHRELVESEGYVRAHLAVPWQRTDASGPPPNLDRLSEQWSCRKQYNQVFHRLSTDSPRQFFVSAELGGRVLATRKLLGQDAPDSPSPTHTTLPIVMQVGSIGRVGSVTTPKKPSE